MNNPDAQISNRNLSVDTFRLLAALCVIILHLEYPALPRSFVIGMRLLSRWAIPFFFIVSGYYFAAQNTDMKRLNIQQMVGRLIWVFLLWSIIYAPVVADQHDLKTVFQRFFSPNFIYFGNFLHLWFISSLVFGFVFIAFCYQFNIKFVLIFFSVTFLVIALISRPYPIFKPGFPLEFGFARHWLSVPFLYIGFYFYKKGFPSWWLSIILIVAGAASQAIEARFIYRQYDISAYDHEFLIGTIPFAIGITGLALNNLKWLQQPLLSNWGRDYSLGIYLVHILVIHIMTNWIYTILPGISGTMIWQALFPVIILGLCILLFEVIRRWLPWLFNFLYGKHTLLHSLTKFFH
ncbi:MAG: acyltransferase [Anaerolineales bacterium]|nr:acyltransferase [Anaerolineales bacterium]